ncbi:MAG: phosphate ABC transporter permease PstA [Candidatus Njordarchaeales archaeon]
MKTRIIIDKIFAFLALISLGIILLPLAHIVAMVIINGARVVNFDFLIKTPRPAGFPGGGIANAIEGSLVLVALTMGFSFPIGLLAGIYLAEYGRGSLAEFIRTLVNALAGMPSIVAGLMAYILIVLYFGFSAVAGAFALSLLAIPYIVRTSEEALRGVPNDIREAGLALGLPKWKVTIYIVLGAAKGRIIIGALLAMARVFGEAAPLLFTAFGNPHHVSSIFEPVDALPLLIFRYALSPYPDWHMKAWGAALLLMIIVLTINLVIRITIRKRYAVRF